MVSALLGAPYVTNPSCRPKTGGLGVIPVSRTGRHVNATLTSSTHVPASGHASSGEQSCLQTRLHRDGFPTKRTAPVAMVGRPDVDRAHPTLIPAGTAPRHAPPGPHGVTLRTAVRQRRSPGTSVVGHHRRRARRPLDAGQSLQATRRPPTATEAWSLHAPRQLLLAVRRAAGDRDRARSRTRPVDTDGDGVMDDEDFAPEDPKVQTEDDVDTDKDGVADYKDDFPKNAQYSKDADGDGVADQVDDFPKDERYSKDSDGARWPTPRTTSPPTPVAQRSPTRCTTQSTCVFVPRLQRVLANRADRPARIRGLRDRGRDLRGRLPEGQLERAGI